MDRQKLGAIVFSNPEALQRLESLVHPPVIAAIDQTIAASHARLWSSKLSSSWKPAWQIDMMPSG